MPERRSRLRPDIRCATASDADFVLDLLASDSVGCRWITRGQPVSRLALETLWSRPATRHYVAFTLSQRPIGYCTAYHIDPGNGHCRAGVVVVNSFERSGAGAFVAVAFLNRLFEDTGLRKVYFESPDIALASYKRALAGGYLSLEGVLREYRRFDERFVDIYLSSATRDDIARAITTLGWAHESPPRGDRSCGENGARR